MRLTFRDALGTLITAAGILAAVGALQGWGWPLLADARAGVITLLVMALFVCPLGFSNPAPHRSIRTHSSWARCWWGRRSSF